MTQTILIGKARRITLDEVYALSCGEAKLEMTIPSDSGGGDGDGEAADDANQTGKCGGVGAENEDEESSLALIAALKNLSLNSTTTTATTAATDVTAAAAAAAAAARGELLSEGATIASLALLSLTLSQGRVIRGGDCAIQLSSALVDLVNAILLLRETETAGRGAGVMLPANGTEFASAVNALLQNHQQGGLIAVEDKPYIGRLILLARVSLMLAQARLLSSKYVSDVLSSLSVERLGQYLSLDAYSTQNYDELRPHRGCIESASVLRACLQGSTLVNVTRKTVTSASSGADGQSNQLLLLQESIKYSKTIPQYHGPAREAIIAACKTMELEMNCSESSSSEEDSVEVDDTVALLACKFALEGVIAMINGSVTRVEGTTTTMENATGTLAELATGLEAAVKELQSALENEAKSGCVFITEKLSEKEAELKAKENEKAKKRADAAASEGGTTANNATDKDEFDGMSEAQKAKILKKRAEKEAKAAAKRKAKEDKASGGQAALSSIFGAGTAAVYPMLSKSTNLLDRTLLAELEKAIDGLLSGGMQRKPKVPKGTRDYLPEQMSIRDKAFTIIRRVFKRHGAVEIDTPVFELKETLTGKYGEDSKLIYDLADQGGEMLALRYDLTVPFARFLAVNAVGNIKRFHIGKVYRRDQPALSRGRYREFYQCDFDIAGVYGRMVPDSECLAVACEILDALPIGDFGIKLNHRRLLDAILDISGVPADRFRTICSAVDKLDKEPWSEVRREMVEDKGLAGEVADRIGEFVVLKGKPWEMYKLLTEGKKFGDHKEAAEAMEDLRICFEYLEAMDKLQFISFDLSLARGLDYYTGVIYEAVCMNGNTQVGSIGGGGRYDNLVSMFQEAGKVTPCVGVSVGIERVFTLMEERLRQEQGGSIKQPNVAVLVASAGDNLLRERMKLAKVLWDANISAEFSQQENPKLKFEIANALDRQIPFMVIAGEEEAKEGKCKVKDLKARTEETVDVSELVKTLRVKGVVPVGCEFAMEHLNSERM
ncbi:hypothetical protein ACHAWU_003341 [Discostella pseudostelligera]|uniref:Histidine--tRNA ligase, cytoplasmic n=1 Tax=Discostella pseudostelligera TaxID=259834 RepID=A0ABD3N9W2_9STRA